QLAVGAVGAAAGAAVGADVRLHATLGAVVGVGDGEARIADGVGRRAAGLSRIERAHRRAVGAVVEVLAASRGAAPAAGRILVDRVTAGAARAGCLVVADA